jgi:hypothetical protein
MTKTIFKKVVWLGRAGTFCVVLAVIVALTVGLATTALAGTGVGARFDLGKTNTVNAVSKLVGSIAGSMLVIDNNGAGTALDLQVGSSTTPPEQKATAPMKVDSQARVANLNSDEVDGVSFSSSLTGILVDPPSVGAHSCVQSSLTVPGMQGGDLATLYPSRNFTAGGDAVTVETHAAIDDGVLFYTVCNLGDAPADPPSGAWGLLVAKPVRN